jgi:hypothetical protein
MRQSPNKMDQSPISPNLTKVLAIEWQPWFSKALVGVGSRVKLIWVMLENNCSSVGKHIPLLHAPFAIYTNWIHGYMYYLHVNNNIYIHFMSKDTIKQYGEIRKLLISSEKSRCYILMNVGTFNNTPQENTHRSQLATPLHMWNTKMPL